MTRLLHTAAAALAMCLTANIAEAQDAEQVTVYGGDLSGIWKVSSPSWFGMDLLRGARWGPPA
jgi:hypothetical protein